MCNQITERFSTILVNEFQRHVMPLIATNLDSIKKQIQSDVAHKITACDQLLKDNIAKMCNNKVTDINFLSFGTFFLNKIKSFRILWRYFPIQY